jgi:methyl-accepting chemotaxis protein
MRLRSSFGVGGKLLLSFALVLIVMGSALVTTLLVLYQAQRAMTDVRAAMPNVMAARDAELGMIDIDDDAANYILETNPKKTGDAYVGYYRQDAQTLARATKELNASANDAVQRTNIAAFNKNLYGPDGNLASDTAAMKYKGAGRTADAAKTIVDSNTDAAEAAIAGYTADVQHQATDTIERAAHLARTALVVGVVGGAFAVALALVLGITAARRISVRVRETSQALRDVVLGDFHVLSGALSALAAGDLRASFLSHSQPLRLDGSDEISELGGSYNALAKGLIEISNDFEQTLAQLRELMRQVAKTASGVDEASLQVSAASAESNLAVTEISRTIDEVAIGVRQQAEHVRLIGSALDELSRNAAAIAAGADEQAKGVVASRETMARLRDHITAAADLADELTSSAANSIREAAAGQQAVVKTQEAFDEVRRGAQRAVDSITALAARSDAVATIISSIDEIADQTNLLALNAAIEAARAGEHGRGFAVVASEIRKLAERSAASTHEISGILSNVQSETREAQDVIRASSQSTESGVVVAAQASSALAMLGDAISKNDAIARTLAERATAMRLESDELIEHATAIGAVVEHNVETVEEMSRGAQRISETIGDVAASAEEQSAATEQFAASVKQLAAQIVQLSGTARGLHDEGEAVRELVSVFALDDEPRPALQRA